MQALSAGETVPGADSFVSATKGVAGVVLAAGLARRMGADKRLAEIGGVPMVLLAVGAAREAGLSPVVVVTGAEGLALLPEGVSEIRNPDPARGMASSLALGIAALPAAARAAVVLLADMPGVTAGHVSALVAAFDPAAGRDICVPVHGGQRGNPVLLGQRFFAAIGELAGDRGARGLIARHASAVAEIEMDAAVLLDVDTPEQLQAARGKA